LQKPKRSVIKVAPNNGSRPLKSRPVPSGVCKAWFELLMREPFDPRYAEVGFGKPKFKLFDN